MAKSSAVLQWARGQAQQLRTAAQLVADLERRPVNWRRSLRLYGLSTDVAGVSPAAGQRALEGLLEAQWRTRDDATAAERADLIARYFAGLSADEQSWLVAHAPSTIGNLDGVPNTVRYAANRLSIQQALADELARLEATPCPLPTKPAYVSWILLSRRVQRYREFLEVTETHGFTSDGRRQVTEDGRDFLMFAPPVWRDGEVVDDGRVAEVLGNLDTATRIGVMVPGITNRIDNFQDLVDAGQRLQEAAAKQSPSAVIVWLGYDTPEFQEAVAPTRAEQGAAALVSTVQGMRRIPGSQVSVLAHSYGTVLTSQALQAGLRPDRVALMGSPGLGQDINAAGDLGLPAGYPIFALRAPGDWVSYTQGHGHDPVTLPGFVRLHTGQEGTAPASGHSQYYRGKTGALANLVAVLAGSGDWVPGGAAIVDEHRFALTVRRVVVVVRGRVQVEQQYALLGDLEPIILQEQHGELSNREAVDRMLEVLAAHDQLDLAPVILNAAFDAAEEEAARAGAAWSLRHGGEMLDSLTGAGSKLSEGVQQQLADLAEGAWDRVGATLSAAEDSAGAAVDAGQAAGRFAIDVGQDITDGAVDAAQIAGQLTIDLWQSGRPWPDQLDRQIDDWQTIVDGAIDQGQQANRQTVDQAQQIADQLIDRSQSTIGGILHSVGKGLDDLAGEIGTTINEVADDLQQHLDNRVDRAREKRREIIDNLVEGS